MIVAVDSERQQDAGLKLVPAPGPESLIQPFAFFLRLRDILATAGEYAVAYRQEVAKSNRWSVPQITPRIQARIEPRNVTPAAKVAWSALPDLFDDARMLMNDSSAVRRCARGIDRLQSLLAEIGDLSPEAGQLAGILAMPEDVVVRVIDPNNQRGFRVQVSGIADLNQFHVLLAHAIIPDSRPTWNVVDACRGIRDPHDPPVVVESRFQFVRPDALRSDGTLPESFETCNHWCWGHESLAKLPMEQGEYVVCIGEPAYDHSWEVERAFPSITAELQLLDVMSADEVGNWLTGRCPDFVANVETEREEREAVAA